MNLGEVTAPVYAASVKGWYGVCMGKLYNILLYRNRI